MNKKLLMSLLSIVALLTGAFLFTRNNDGHIQSLGANVFSKDEINLPIDIENDPDVQGFKKLEKEIPSGTKVAIIKDGKVLNSVLVPEGWPDIENAWQPPEGTTVVLVDSIGPGDVYDGAEFYRPIKNEKAKSTVEAFANKKNLTDEEQQFLIKELLKQKNQ